MMRDSTLRCSWARGALGAQVVVLALGGGCGARTDLGPGDAPSSAGEGGGPGTTTGGAGGSAPTGCPRADAPARLVIPEFSPQHMGGMASDGCAFAATWLELRDGVETVLVSTFRVVDGAWQASAAPSLAVAGATNNSPAIAWDGEAYVVAWANEVLQLQRVSAGGEPLGQPVPSFEAPGNVYVRWIEPLADGSLRVGFTGHGGDTGYDVHVARVGAGGEVLAAPQPLTASGDADIVGFFVTPGGGTALWTVGHPDGVALVQGSFDDQGLLGEPRVLMTADNVLGSRHGTATAAGVSHFGVLRVSPAELVIGQLTDGGFTQVTGVPGGDVPTLAATARGALGVAARRSRLDPTSPLELTVVEGGVVTSTEVLGDSRDSYGHVMAAGEDTLGVYWASPEGGTFASWSP